MVTNRSVRFTRIDVEPDDFVELIRTIVDGGAIRTFFTNEQGSIFVPSGHGYTKMHDPNRKYDFRGKSRLLDAVAESYQKIRPEGGRFLLDSQGAKRADNGDYFVKWNRSAALMKYVASLPQGPVFQNRCEWLAHFLSKRI